MEGVLIKAIDYVIEKGSGDIAALLFILLVLFIGVVSNDKSRVGFFAFLFSVKNLLTKRKHFYLKGAAIFLNEKFYLQQVDDISFGDDDKDFIFRTIMHDKTVIVVEELRKVVDEFKSYKSYTKEQLVSMLTVLTYNIIDKYEYKIREDLIARYGKDKGLELYNCVYDNKHGKQGFKQYHERNVNYIVRFLDGVVHTPISDPYFIMYSYLTAVNVALSTAILDLYNVFETFNGDLIKIIKDD